MYRRTISVVKQTRFPEIMFRLAFIKSRIGLSTTQNDREECKINLSIESRIVLQYGEVRIQSTRKMSQITSGKIISA